MDNLTLIYIAAGVVLLLVFIFAVSYVKTSPTIAYIVSGLRREPKIFAGKGGIRIPGLQQLDKLYLGQLSVDVQTAGAVPTEDFINVYVDGIAKVQVDPAQIQLAAKNFPNMAPEAIAKELVETLQGNMRECIGRVALKTLLQDRNAFAQQVVNSASADMKALGIQIISFNIQSVDDTAKRNGKGESVIENLGMDNLAQITKTAHIKRAEAERDVKMAVADADREANERRVAADTAIAEQNNTLAIRRADLKREADTRQAEADAAYRIQEQEQAKVINAKTVEAETEKTKRQQELTAQQVQVMQNRLEAEVNKKADAMKYQTEIEAAADLEQRKRKAEAELYEQQRKAEAIKAEAEARLYAAQQEAAGIKAKGEAEAAAKKAVLLAEAEGIKAQGLAEAEAMEKKAEAFEKYGKAAMAQMMIDKLPEVAKSVAEPIGNIDNLNIYSHDGNEAASISGLVPTLVHQAMDTMSNATGVPMADLVRANSIEAKVNRNVSLDGGVDVSK